MVQSGGQGSGDIGGPASYSLGSWHSQPFGHWVSWVPTGNGSLGAQQWRVEHGVCLFAQCNRGRASPATYTEGFMDAIPL